MGFDHSQDVIRGGVRLAFSCLQECLLLNHELVIWTIPSAAWSQRQSYVMADSQNKKVKSTTGNEFGRPNLLRKIQRHVTL